MYGLESQGILVTSFRHFGHVCLDHAVQAIKLWKELSYEESCTSKPKVSDYDNQPEFQGLNSSKNFLRDICRMSIQIQQSGKVDNDEN